MPERTTKMMPQTSAPPSVTRRRALTAVWSRSFEPASLHSSGEDDSRIDFPAIFKPLTKSKGTLSSVNQLITTDRINRLPFEFVCASR